MKLGAFKNSMREIPRVLNVKRLQQFYAQDLFGI
jgi:hypothetical protein